MRLLGEALWRGARAPPAPRMVTRAEPVPQPRAVEPAVVPAPQNEHMQSRGPRRARVDRVGHVETRGHVDEVRDLGVEPEAPPRVPVTRDELPEREPAVARVGTLV